MNRRRTTTIAEKQPLQVMRTKALVDSMGPHGWATPFLRSLNDVKKDVPIEFRCDHVDVSDQKSADVAPWNPTFYDEVTSRASLSFDHLLGMTEKPR